MNCTLAYYRDHGIQESVIKTSRCWKYYLETVEESKDIVDQQPPEKFTRAAICYICVILAVLVISLTGTLITFYDYLNKSCRNKNHSSKTEQSENASKKTEAESKTPQDSFDEGITIKSICKCFCVYSNGKKLFTPSAADDPLNSIHGLRCISSIVVIFEHAFCLYLYHIKSFENVTTVMTSWYTHFLMSGVFIVNVFFVIGGFLNAYYFCSEYAKTNGKISYFMFYIHRIVRITPAYMAVYWFYVVLLSYSGSGPVWPSFTTNSLCMKKWWLYLLYLNNIERCEDTCIPWYWYLAADLQLYVISPIFMVALMKRPRLGYTLIGIAIFIGSLYCSLMTYMFNLVDGFTRVPEYMNDLVPHIDRFWDYFDFLYTKSISRLGPYMVGILLGYYMYKRKINKSGKLSPIILCCGWLITAFLMWVYFFALFGTKEDLWVNTMYAAIKDLSFACGYAWIIFACTSGHGGFLNKFLSWKFFHPISRIGLCTYLTHIVIVTRYGYLSRGFIEPELKTLILWIGKIIPFSLASAFVVCLLFEAPVIRLFSLYAKYKFARKKNE